MTNTPEASAFKLNRRGFLGLGAAAGIVASLAACSPSSSGSGTPSGSAPAANADGVITAAISDELNADYDPFNTTAALTMAANWHVFEGLTEVDLATREAYPGLGAAMPTKIDDTTYEVKLRDGAVFHDGTKVTVDDVVFSYQTATQSKSPVATFIKVITGITKKDDSTVTIKLAYPLSVIGQRLSVLKIAPQAAYSKDPKAFALAPIGSGPYKMTDNGAGSKKVVFERNDAYTGTRKAMAKKMEWQLIKDDATRTNALQSGTVQAIDSVPIANLATLAPKKVAAQQGFNLVFAMFNFSTPMGKDLNVRKAVMSALDYDKIVKTGMGDLATPATCFVYEGHPAYKKASATYENQAAKAKELVAALPSKKLNVVAANHPWWAGVRPIIKESLTAAGFEVNFREVASADIYNKIIPTEPQGYDVVFAPGDPSPWGIDADVLLRWWYANDLWTDTRIHWKGEASYTKAQELIDSAAKASGDEQMKLWHETFDLLSENLPLYPIFHRKVPTGWDDQTLTNFKPIAVPGLSFIGVGSTKK